MDKPAISITRRDSLIDCAGISHDGPSNEMFKMPERALQINECACRAIWMQHDQRDVLLPKSISYDVSCSIELLREATHTVEAVRLCTIRTVSMQHVGIIIHVQGPTFANAHGSDRGGQRQVPGWLAFCGQRHQNAL